MNKNKENILSNSSSVLITIIVGIILIFVMMYIGTGYNKGTYSTDDTEAVKGYCYEYNNEYIIWSQEPILESGYNSFFGTPEYEDGCHAIACTQGGHMLPYYGEEPCPGSEGDDEQEVEGYCYLFNEGGDPGRNWYYWTETPIPDAWNPTGAYELQEDITERSNCPHHQCVDFKYVLTDYLDCKLPEEIDSGTTIIDPDDENNENGDTYLAKFIDYDGTEIETRGCYPTNGSCERTVPRKRTRDGYEFLGYSLDCNSATIVPAWGTITLSSSTTVTYYACYKLAGGSGANSSSNTNTGTTTGTSSSASSSSSYSNTGSSINNNQTSSSYRQEYSSQSSQKNVNNNADTGTFSIVFAWIIGIMAIGYSFYYFKKYS